MQVAAQKCEGLTRFPLPFSRARGGGWQLSAFIQGNGGQWSISVP